MCARLCHDGSVDFGIAAVRVVAEGLLWATLSAEPLAVEPLDPGDLLAPGSWVLTGPAAPQVVRATAQGGTTLALDLDAPLAPGVVYQLALDPSARAAQDGAPTSTSPVEVVGRGQLGQPGVRAGALAGDLALPLVASGGRLGVVDRLEALRRRCIEMARVRRGAHTHAPDWGRGVEPKRTYSAGALASEAAALKALLLGDPDVRAARVSASSDGHVMTFAMQVTPSFDAEPLNLNEGIELP